MKRLIEVSWPPYIILPPVLTACQQCCPIYLLDYWLVLVLLEACLVLGKRIRLRGRVGGRRKENSGSLPPGSYGTTGRTLCRNGPQPFRPQGSVLWKTVFPGIRGGGGWEWFGDDSVSLHLLCCPRSNRSQSSGSNSSHGERL